MRAPDHVPSPDPDWVLVGRWIGLLLCAGAIVNLAMALSIAGDWP